MRTSAEIAARIALRRLDDPLGFETSEYLLALNYDDAAPFLKPGSTTREAWDSSIVYRSDADLLTRMKSYVDFAYEKINDERGISANRSISHYVAWLFLIGNDSLREWVEDEFGHRYHSYGRHIMDRIVAEYGWKPARRYEPSEYHGPAHHELNPKVYQAFLRSSGKLDSPATQLEFNKTADRFASGQMVMMKP